jgi:NADH-quinone oxidoreductase subunit G
MIAAAEKGALEVLYLLGADEIDTLRLGKSFVIYQGTHGDVGAHRADVILPGATYTEKSATYVNTEGRVQMTVRAVFPPGEAKEDWAIIRALSAAVGKTLPFDTLSAVRGEMYKSAPHLAALDDIAPAGSAGIERLAIETASAPGSAAFAAPVHDFYLTNPIARASRVMAEMSAFRAGLARAVAAE